MNIKSWHGKHTLKTTVLSQMEDHHDKAVLEKVLIDGVELEVYGWKNAMDFSACARILGLDKGMLHLAYYLFDGFPEDRNGIRTVIAERTTIFESVPVNVSLSQICPEFILWRIEHSDFGIKSPVVLEEIDGLFSELTTQFYQDLSGLESLESKTRTMLSETNAAVAKLWQQQQRTDKDLYAKINALETALAACRVLTDVESAADTAKTYLFGANGTNTRNIDEEMERMCRKFIELLQAAR